jgi:hypothetical protein
MDLSHGSGDGGRRRTINRGLDGGYWSTLQMSSITDNVRHKRTRTTVERLELSYLPLIAQSNTSLTERVSGRGGSRSANTSIQHANNASDNDSSSQLGADENSTHSTSTQNTSTSGPRTSKNSADRVILFKSHSYLAVRNDEGTFFLCLALTNIFEHSKQSKIQWLEDVKPPKIYKLGTVDWLDPLSIICKVHMKRVGESRLEIDDSDLKKVNKLLAIALEEGGIHGELDDEEETTETESSDADAIRKKQQRVRQSDPNAESRGKADAKLKKLIQDQDFFDNEESSSRSESDKVRIFNLIHFVYLIY